MTLKALAQEALSRLSAPGVPAGTGDGTPVEHMEQETQPCSSNSISRSIALERPDAWKSANLSTCSTVPLLGDGSAGTALPAHIVEAVRRLPQRRPKVTATAVWQRTVKDAGRLVKDGWAASAVALGWSLYDLFGIGPRDSDEWLSLAVWLDGKTITIMDDHQAVTAEGRIYYRETWGRPDSVFVAPIFLWEFGA